MDSIFTFLCSLHVCTVRISVVNNKMNILAVHYELKSLV